MRSENIDKAGVGIFWLVVALTLLCIMLLPGCSTTRDVEYVYTHDTVYQNKVVHDSVDRWHTHYEFVKGDTVHSIDTFYRDRWYQKVDTVHETKTVVLPPEKVYVEVEKKVYVWWPLWVILGGIIAGSIYLLIRFKPWKGMGNG